MTVRGHIVVGDADTDAVKECPACGFEALLTFPLYVVSEAGVTQFATAERCAHCWTGEGT